MFLMRKATTLAVLGGTLTLYFGSLAGAEENKPAARAAHVDASEIGRAPVAFKAPMTVESAAETKEKLTIDLVFKRANPKDVTLRVSWGKLQLSAPVQVPVPSAD